MFIKKQHWANLITLSRILGVCFLFLIPPFTTNKMVIGAILLYTVLALTDLLDGWIARKYKTVSDLGKILDPLADKILVLIFLPLLSMGVIGAFPVFIVLAREFAIMGVRVFSAKHGLIIPASPWGKIKTGIVLPLCGVLLARISVEAVSLPLILQPIEFLRLWVYSWPQWIITAWIWAMVLSTVVSFLDYFFKFLWQRHLKLAEGDVKKAKKSLASYIPNTITFINLISGFISCYYSLQGNITLAAAWILTGVLLDASDGKIARALGVFSKFGAQLDSKADFMTFGIAPGVLIFAFTSSLSFSYAPYLGALLGFAFYASVHFRLRRFDKGGHSDFFEGLPSPAGATYLCLFVVSQHLHYPIITLIMAVICALLMISTFQYPHNSISNKVLLFRWARMPSLIFWFVTLFQLFGAPIPATFFIPEILFVLTGPYLFAPVILYLFPIKSDH